MAFIQGLRILPQKADNAFNYGMSVEKLCNAFAGIMEKITSMWTASGAQMISITKNTMRPFTFIS